MSLLKSLLCIRGFDNGRRFLLLSLACYGLFFLLSPVLGKAPILLVLLLLVVTPVLGASSMRRIHDAGFATPFAAGAVVIFWICSLGITYIEHIASYSLLVLALLVTLAMTTITNARVRRNRDYVLGYSGPLNQTEESQLAQQRRYYDRIEPTIASSNSGANPKPAESNGQGQAGQPEQVANDYIESSLVSESGNNRENFHRASNTGTRQVGWETKLGDWFAENLKVSLLGAAAVIIIVIAIVGVNTTDGPDEVTDPAKTQEIAKEAKLRNHKIELPDNFFVMLDQYQALTIAWQGDLLSDGEIWLATTALGDAECTEIRFDNGDKYRTMRVEVKNQGDYYADFSPVDTLSIIEAIAQKSRFSLCGFDFSLKGTQSILMTNKAYYEYLTQE